MSQHCESPVADALVAIHGYDRLLAAHLHQLAPSILANIEKINTSGCGKTISSGRLRAKVSVVAKKGHFWGILGPQNGIFGGPKGSKLTPLDVKYNVQPCSTNVQPNWGRWDCIWPNMTFFGQKRSFLRGSGAPKWHFWGAKGVQTHPPRCEVQCSTMFNQCSTQLGSLGLPMAQYGIFWPKKVIFGGFWGPKMPFLGGQRGPNSPPQM